MLTTFQPLVAKDHTKKYLKDKEYRQQYKQFLIDNTTNWVNQLSNIIICMISNDSDMFYMVSPSLYKNNQIQLTTFIRNIPHSHNTYQTIDELVKDNHIHFYFNQYQLIDSIKEAI